MNTTSRAVTATYPALARTTHMNRLLGSLDVIGQGTLFEQTDLGPFVLVEDARGVQGPGKPTFGLHPHAGLLVASYIADGGPWRSHSNAPGFEDIPVPSGSALLTFSGRGVQHDERTDSDGEHALLQMILRLPRSTSGLASWLKTLTPTRIAPGVLCVFDPEALRDTGVDAALHHITLAPGTSTSLTLPDTHTHGFVYARQGHAHVAGQPLAPGHAALLGDSGATLRLEASPDTRSELFVATGADIDEPWVKLLGHDGFVIAPDADTAAQLLQTYADNPMAFGH